MTYYIHVERNGFVVWKFLAGCCWIIQFCSYSASLPIIHSSIYSLLFVQCSLLFFSQHWSHSLCLSVLHQHMTKQSLKHAGKANVLFISIFKLNSRLTFFLIISKTCLSLITATEKNHTKVTVKQHMHRTRLGDF